MLKSRGLGSDGDDRSHNASRGIHIKLMLRFQPLRGLEQDEA